MKKSARLKIALLLICPAGTALRADPGTQEVFNSIGSRSISWIAIIPFLLLTALVIFLIITVIMRRRTEMSLRQANLVVENSPAVLFRWRAAPGWPVDFVSKNVIQFGYTVEELVSGLIPFSSMIHPDDLERVAAEVERYSASGNDIYIQEYRIISKNGDLHWVDDRSTIERHPDGSIHHYQGILMDITDRRIAEDNLKHKNEELDRIFNISQDMLCVMDTRGRFIRLNRPGSMCWAIRYPKWKAGVSGSSSIHDDDDISLRSAARLMEGMDVLNLVNRFRHRDGSCRWLESSLTPYSDSLIYAAARDVTARKKTEEALRQSEKRLSEIIDFLPDATFVIDRDGRIIIWNRAVEELTGFSSKDMLGKDDHEYAIPFYGIRRPILIDLVFEANEEVEAGYHYIKRSGDSLMAEATINLRGRNTTLWAKIAKLTDSEGNALGAIETLRDITEHKQMLEEQSKLREQLFQSQKMESMGLLAGGIAHDFNNMLTPIIGYSELMMLNLQAGDPNRQRVEQIQRSAELMRHLTSRLLAFSRKQVLDLKVISIPEVVRGFEPIIHRTIRENIEIHINADPGWAWCRPTGARWNRCF
jgi:PAS domain S-box-containing protein